MSLLPLIQRPCPYLDRLESVMEGDFCRMCKREIHDLTGMDPAGRSAFLAACGGDACIRYSFNARPALAAALIAASVAVAAAPAMATPRGHAARHVTHPPRQARVPVIPMVTAGLPPPVTTTPQLEPTPPPPTVPDGTGTPPPKPK